MNFKNKVIAVIGFGVEGFSSAMYLADKGATVTVLDKRSESELDGASLKKATKRGISFVFGKNYLSDLLTYDLIVKSPGVKKSLPKLVEAEKKGIQITSQTELFLELCPAMVIGVTGTKGKGTTASLIYEMLKESGFDAHLGGNIGVAPFDFLDTLTPQSRVVLELSSFQLLDLSKSPTDAHALVGKPHIAVMLMVTSEHLDYHADHAEYIEAKRNIFKYQTASDFAVINRDYPASNESDIYTDGQVFFTSRERSSTEKGCFVKDGAVFMAMQGAEWKVIDIKAIKLPGKHNLENVCASVMASTLAGASKEAIVKVLTQFSGLEHRLELVREVGGVQYYDDSFSTTPETAIAAIEAFSGPEIVILGGSSKKSDFTELGSVIASAENIKAIIGIGDEWPRIKEAIKAFYSSSKAKSHAEKKSGDSSSGQARVVPPLMVEGAKDMKTIVQAASKLAAPGDIVLLSPACASFGMFENYKVRGEQFKNEVLKLE